ncbi:MAG TPA: aminotransferase class V-fold PLP-dependent enzyme [Vicinamibacterales bacterium]|nr:aminotransferase class V-fold PLP-dependent enzyme [Vicinamibacterales bacterium]
MTLNRREFARVFAAGGSAALFAHPAFAGAQAPPLPSAGAAAGERFWTAVRDQFVLPPGLAVMNAANLCPSTRAVLESMYAGTRDVDQDPSPANRAKLYPAREETRRRLAAFLRVAPEEIVITRNTSESNNLVSNGLDLKPGDEVVIFADNHPSNNAAWRAKGKRFGYTVTELANPNPHPGADYYVEVVRKALSSRTKVLAFTHMTSPVGDVMPAAEMCRLARERGVLSMVDGAQSFGLMDVDLSAIQPDFYSGSAHKWPCGPKEAGVLFVSARVQDRLWPTIYSAYPGAVGFSRSFEGFGQRDDAAIVAFGEAIAFQDKVGRASVEARARQLTTALLHGLAKIPGVRLWTSTVPERRAAVASFQPGAEDPQKLATALYDSDRIGCATLGGQQPGLRFSPHLYNTAAEVDRVLAAVTRYMKSGVS